MILTVDGCGPGVFWDVGSFGGNVQFEFVLNTGDGYFFFTSSNQPPYDTSGCQDSCSSGSFSVAVAQVPEPATLVLLGLGLSGLALTRRKSNRQ